MFLGRDYVAYTIANNRLWKQAFNGLLTIVHLLWLHEYSSIAQSVEHSAVNRSVAGSSPAWGVKTGNRLEIWLRGQAVKTSPFHGGNTGSIPVGVIKKLLAIWA